MVKKSQLFFFYFLGGYVILQFTWWAYHIIQLTREVGYTPEAVDKRVGMIIGEGLVFFLILIFGIWRMARSIKKEQQLARRQNNFLLSVTHELKTPVASIKLYIQTLLKRNFESEKREELLQLALKENERLDQLVEAILISARLENRTLQLHKEEINLNLLLEDLRKKYELQLGKDWIKLELAADLVLFADAFVIKTIMLNLIENALKYAGTTQSLVIRAQKDEHKIRIRVSDQGPGVPSEQVDSIFHKFVRLENEETRSQKGTGLGLFIVKEFVRLCDGKIVYKDTIPSGATFEISL